MKKIALLCCSLSVALFLVGPAAARMRPIPKQRAGIPPFTVIKAIVHANQQQVVPAARQSAPPEATPWMTWLADCDARVHAGMVMDADADRLFAVCALGNQLALVEGAVDYGVRELYSPVLLITGHTGSESLRAAMEGYSHLGEAIRRDLDQLRLPPPAKGKKEQTPAAHRWLQLVEENVDYQVAQAVARYRDRIKEGRLVVVGGVIDLLNQYGAGRNRLFLININGETDPARLKKLRHLVQLDPAQLNHVGRRPPKPAP